MTRILWTGIKIVLALYAVGLLLGCGGSTSSDVAPVPPVNLASAAACPELVNGVRDTSVFPPNVAIVLATSTPRLPLCPYPKHAL